MIIQDPKMIALKENRARESVGKHLLVGIVAKNGFVFARKRSGRSDQVRLKNGRVIPSWFAHFEAHILLATIGDLSGMSRFRSAVRDGQGFIENMTNMRYVTGRFTEKFASRVMREEFEEGVFPLGIMALFASFDNPEELSIIDFDGKLKRFSYFAITGCALNTDEFREAKSGAIEYLSHMCRDGRSMRWRAEGNAKRRAIQVFKDFDPPGSNSVVDLVLVLRKKDGDKQIVCMTHDLSTG